MAAVLIMMLVLALALVLVLAIILPVILLPRNGYVRDNMSTPNIASRLSKEISDIELVNIIRRMEEYVRFLEIPNFSDLTFSAGIAQAKLFFNIRNVSPREFFSDQKLSRNSKFGKIFADQFDKTNSPETLFPTLSPIVDSYIDQKVLSRPDITVSHLGSTSNDILKAFITEIFSARAAERMIKWLHLISNGSIPDVLLQGIKYYREDDEIDGIEHIDPD
ncbi:5269_t:CDS:2 [Funneliformis caledonium]|uniref:5269_t:CDS:1 n=1 Tax=Funneliformis caledonium TaxID=1117310 RepID=A0A9N9DAJ6_9GLOM|nr:5269_t:CDS:2 [Funneliformis caledonium]